MNGGKASGYVSTRKAKAALGVCEDTLRKWADNGLFPSLRTPGGQRLYNITKYLETQGVDSQPSSTPKQAERICYCRVSSQGQKNDLERQVAYMQSKFPEHRIVTDIGSGINFKRRGLRSVLELSSKGLVSEVVVAYRDRMCRFAFELVEWVLQLHGVKLVVLHQEVDSSGQSELAEDLLAIVNVLNCRVNGKRKYKTKKDGEAKEKASGELLQESQVESAS
jgi:putative resolvase